MSPLIKDLLIKGLMAGTAVKTAKRTSAGMAIYALAGVIALMGLVFLAMAGFFLLEESHGAPIAAGMTGCVILLLSICVGIGAYYAKRKRVVKKPSSDGLIDNVEDKIKSLLHGFEEPVKDNPKLALLMAALAGFAAGDHLHETR